MSKLRKLTIKQRLGIMVGVVIIGLMFQSAMSLKQLDSSLNAQQSEKIKQIVETAHGTFKYFHQLEQNNSLTQEEAKKQALAVINGLRFGGNEYFWVNNLEPRMIMLFLINGLKRVLKNLLIKYLMSWNFNLGG